MRIRRSLRRNR